MRELKELIRLFEENNNKITRQQLLRFGLSQPTIDYHVASGKFSRYADGSYQFTDKFQRSFTKTLPAGVVRLDRQLVIPRQGVTLVDAQQQAAKLLEGLARRENRLIEGIRWKGLHFDVDFIPASYDAIEGQLAFESLVKSPAKLLERKKVVEGKGQWVSGYFYKSMANMPASSLVPSEVIQRSVSAMQRRHPEAHFVIDKISVWNARLAKTQLSRETYPLAGVKGVLFDPKGSVGFEPGFFSPRSGIRQQLQRVSEVWDKVYPRLLTRGKQIASLTFRRLPVIGAGVGLWISADNIAEASDKLRATAIEAGGWTGGLYGLAAGCVAGPLGCLVGGVAGGFIGEEGAAELYDRRNPGAQLAVPSSKTMEPIFRDARTSEELVVQVLAKEEEIKATGSPEDREVLAAVKTIITQANQLEEHVVRERELLAEHVTNTRIIQGLQGAIGLTGQLSQLAYARGNEGLGKALSAVSASFQGANYAVMAAEAIGLGVFNPAAAVMGIAIGALSVFLGGSKRSNDELRAIHQAIDAVRKEMAQFKQEVFIVFDQVLYTIQLGFIHLEQVILGGQAKLDARLQRLKVSSDALHLHNHEEAEREAALYGEAPELYTPTEFRTRLAGVAQWLVESRWDAHTGVDLYEIQQQSGSPAVAPQFAAIFSKPNRHGQLPGYTAAVLHERGAYGSTTVINPDMWLRAAQSLYVLLHAGQHDYPAAEALMQRYLIKPADRYIALVTWLRNHPDYFNRLLDEMIEAVEQFDATTRYASHEMVEKSVDGSRQYPASLSIRFGNEQAEEKARSIRNDGSDFTKRLKPLEAIFVYPDFYQKMLENVAQWDSHNPLFPLELLALESMGQGRFVVSIRNIHQKHSGNGGLYGGPAVFCCLMYDVDILFIDSNGGEHPIASVQPISYPNDAEGRRRDDYMNAPHPTYPHRPHSLDFARAQLLTIRRQASLAKAERLNEQFTRWQEVLVGNRIRLLAALITAGAPTHSSLNHCLLDFSPTRLIEVYHKDASSEDPYRPAPDIATYRGPLDNCKVKLLAMRESLQGWFADANQTMSLDAASVALMKTQFSALLLELPQHRAALQAKQEAERLSAAEQQEQQALPLQQLTAVVERLSAQLEALQSRLPPTDIITLHGHSCTTNPKAHPDIEECTYSGAQSTAENAWLLLLLVFARRQLLWGYDNVSRLLQQGLRVAAERTLPEISIGRGVGCVYDWPRWMQLLFVHLPSKALQQELPDGASATALQPYYCSPGQTVIELKGSWIRIELHPQGILFQVNNTLVNECLRGSMRSGLVSFARGFSDQSLRKLDVSPRITKATVEILELMLLGVCYGPDYLGIHLITAFLSEQLGLKESTIRAMSLLLMTLQCCLGESSPFTFIGLAMLNLMAARLGDYTGRAAAPLVHCGLRFVGAFFSNLAKSEEEVTYFPKPVFGA